MRSIWLPYTPFSATHRRLLVGVQVAAALLFWCFSTSGGLPTPMEVLRAWVSLVQTQSLISELWQSAQVLLLALLLSTLLSVTLVAAGTAPVFAPLARAASLLRFLGFAGLTYLFMLVTRDSTELKLALLVFGISAMMVTAMLAEVRAIPQQSIDHCQTLGMQHWRITYELVVLGKADVFFDLVRQNAAIGWTLLTMVEGLTRSQGGIGALLLNQNRYFQLAGVFAIQLTILLYGIGQDYLLGRLGRVMCPYGQLQTNGGNA